MNIDKNKYELKLNITNTVANAIRRTILSKIDTYVIDTVCIEQNDCCLCDDMIANRFGLIPLTCTDFDENSETEIKINVTGPKRVYSGDIIFPPGIQPVSDKIILFNLDKNQSVKLKGNIKQGNPESDDHYKYSVDCGTTFYKTDDDDMIHLKVETTGALTAKDALLRSLEILKEDLQKYKKLLL